MTTTIEKLEVDERVLRAAMERAHTSEPKAAVLQALNEFARPRSQKDLVKYLGTFEDFMTPEELDDMRRQS